MDMSAWMDDVRMRRCKAGRFTFTKKSKRRRLLVDMCHGTQLVESQAPGMQVAAACQAPGTRAAFTQRRCSLGRGKSRSVVAQRPELTENTRLGFNEPSEGEFLKAQREKTKAAAVAATCKTRLVRLSNPNCSLCARFMRLTRSLRKFRSHFDLCVLVQDAMPLLMNRSLSTFKEGIKEGREPTYAPKRKHPRFPVNAEGFASKYATYPTMHHHSTYPPMRSRQPRLRPLEQSSAINHFLDTEVKTATNDLLSVGHSDLCWYGQVVDRLTQSKRWLRPGPFVHGYEQTRPRMVSKYVKAEIEHALHASAMENDTKKESKRLRKKKK